MIYFRFAGGAAVVGGLSALFLVGGGCVSDPPALPDGGSDGAVSESGGGMEGGEAGTGPWSVRIPDVLITALAVRADRGVYATGLLVGNTLKIGSKDFNVLEPNTSEPHAFLASIHPTGEAEWVVMVDGKADNFINGMGFIPNDGVVIVGDTRSRPLLIGNKTIALGAPNDRKTGFVAKISLGGTVAWAYAIGQTTMDWSVRAVAISNKILVGGSYESETLVPRFGTPPNDKPITAPTGNVNGELGFMASLDKTNGELVPNSGGGTDSVSFVPDGLDGGGRPTAFVRAVGYDSAGDPVAGGVSRGSWHTLGPNNTVSPVQSPGGEDDGFVVAFDHKPNNLPVKWIASIRGPGNDSVNAIAPSLFGQDPLVVGNFTGSATQIGKGPAMLTAVDTGSDLFAVQLDSTSGMTKVTKGAGGMGDDVGESVATCGAIMKVGALSTNGFTVGNGNLPAKGAAVIDVDLMSGSLGNVTAWGTMAMLPSVRVACQPMGATAISTSYLGTLKFMGVDYAPLPGATLGTALIIVLPPP